MAIEGLEALEFGEYTSIFEKKDIRLHYRYQEMKLQLAALAHVDFRSKFSRRIDAQWEVAEAYDVDADTLRQWIGPLRERLGKLEVSRARAFARNCATNAIHAQKARRAGKTEVIDVWSARHDAAAIKRDGDAFKALRASKTQNQAS
jgi:transposase-like protein